MYSLWQWASFDVMYWEHIRTLIGVKNADFGSANEFHRLMLDFSCEPKESYCEATEKVHKHTQDHTTNKLQSSGVICCHWKLERTFINSELITLHRNFLKILNSFLTNWENAAKVWEWFLPLTIWPWIKMSYGWPKKYFTWTTWPHVTYQS